jgi:hypothetical protein
MSVDSARRILALLQTPGATEMTIEALSGPENEDSTEVYLRCSATEAITMLQEYIAKNTSKQFAKQSAVAKARWTDPEYREKVKVAKEATRQRKMESNATPSASESYKDISPLSEKSDAIHTAGNEDNA